MAFHHYISSEEESLANKLAERLKDVQKNAVFSKHFIIVEHNSTKDYLNDLIARKNTISANLVYEKPLGIIKAIHRSLELSADRNELLGEEEMVWLIDSLLEDNQNDTIREYIEDAQIKRYTLAQKIADLFSSYQLENPKLIEAWNKGKLLSDAADEKWQFEIWKELKLKQGDKIEDLTKIFEEIKDALDAPDKQVLLKEKFPAIFCYGELTYSSQIIELLEKLGEFIEVAVFRRIFSMDKDNYLVQNIGSTQLKSEELWAGKKSEKLDVKASHSGTSLLAQLQNKIKGNEAEKVTIDDSLIISSSYSIPREVEAFYHHIHHVFENNNELGARDVCVIVPDIAAYAPSIHTYFEESKIPYRLYDTKGREVDSPYAAFEAILEFDEDSFTSVIVAKLLDYKHIRNNFGFSEDTENVRRAISLANIRHSYEQEDETKYVSWKYGLKKLIFGYCLPPSTDEVTFHGDSFTPVDEFEESNGVELFKLNALVESLNTWLKEREEPRTMDEWTTFLSDSFDQFIHSHEFDTTGFQRILGKLKKAATFRDDKISFPVMQYHLKQALSSIESMEAFGHGGIQFVSPSPYLSTPTKMYAFLGLNAGDFPRKYNPLSFDLIKENRLTPTDQDKNLFLNLILSSEENLYISYIGNSVKDNSTIPPSSLVAEILQVITEEIIDYGVEKPKEPAKDFIIRHPLHGFSSNYNQDGSRLVRYKSTRNTQVLKEKALDENENIDKDKINPQNQEKRKVIELWDLIKFAEDPVRHYFNKTIGIYYGDRDIELQDTEIFELNSLEQWQVKNDCVQNYLKGNKDDDDDELIKNLKAHSKIPLSNLGNSLFENYKDEAQEIIDNIPDNCISVNQTPLLNKELNVGDIYTIRGTIESIYDNTLLFATPSSCKLKYQVRAMIQYYFAKAFKPQIELAYVVKGNNKIVQTSSNDHIKILEDWCKLYEEGSESLIPYSTELKINENENVNDKINKACFGENSSVYSDYFKKIAENDAFKNEEWVEEFDEMQKKAEELVKDLVEEKKSKKK